MFFRLYLKVRIFLIQTYAIEDCTFYSPSTYNNANTEWASNTPTNFKATFEVEYLSSGSGGVGAYFQIGEANKGILCGYYGQSQVRIFDWQIGSSGTKTIVSNLTGNAYHDVEISYNEGTWTVKVDDTTDTYSKTYTTRDYVGCRCEQRGYIKNVKIKPL